MKKDVLFLVYKFDNPSVIESRSKRLERNPFDLSWGMISVDQIFRDDFQLSEIKNAVTIDDLIISLKDQAN